MTEANDWEYRCTSCAKMITAGADFNELCPNCGGYGWLCHLISRQTHTSESPGLGQNVEGVITPPGNLSQPIVANNRPLSGETESPPAKLRDVSLSNNKPGPKPRGIPGDLINQLSRQGLSSRQIAADLAARGFNLSYKSVQRYFKRHKQGSFL